jgi:tryptophan halogenase
MIKIKSVDSMIIVGGGTSAWLCAAYMSHNHSHLNITIVDKEVGNPVGVGEGTLLSFDKVMGNCGFDIQDWFPKIDAAAKAGILFPGWGKDQYKDVWHPFKFQGLQHSDMSLFDCWASHQEYDFKKYGLTFYENAVEKNLVDVTELDAHAFHIDAGKLVTYIQEKLNNRRRVTIIRSDVVEVLRNSDTHEVTELVLKDGRRLSADLYVDCTGFKAILDHEPDRVDLSGRLFCDTAIAAHVPYEDIDTELRPYVISEQVEHGWVWNIPVQTRIGSGLVFNRTQTSIEEAKDFFVNYWDNRISKDNLKVIDWTPYYKNNIWNKNVVSIGLSAGFIEPLESTGVALIIVGIEQLSFAIDSRSYTSTHTDCYNLIMKGYFEDSIDFVSMHYANPTREGKLWDWVRATFVKSQRQLHYEKEMLRDNTVLPIKGYGYMFCGSNWFCWLIQMGYKLSESLSGLDKQQTHKELMKFYNYETSKYTRSVPHREYITSMITGKSNFVPKPYTHD